EPLGVVLLFVPLGVPALDDAQAEPDRMCFLTHGYASSCTTTVMWLVRRWMRLARPMARGIHRLMIGPLSTWIVFMTSGSTSALPLDLSSALDAALWTSLEMMRALFLGSSVRTPSASSTRLPRIMFATMRTFRGDIRT